jgi:tetratricopeptide (TPR) repeat protein
VAYHRGDYGTARALTEEGLAIERELGVHRGVASLNSLARIARSQGDHREARSLFGESLAICQEQGRKLDLAECLEEMAWLASEQRQGERAARLFGTAEALREAMGAALAPVDRAEHDRSVVAARTGLGEEAFAAAWAEGRALSLEDAIKYALED